MASHVLRSTDWLPLALAQNDPYIAAAIHDHVASDLQQQLWQIMLASSRDRLKRAQESFTPAAVLAGLAWTDDHRLHYRLARHPKSKGAGLAAIYQSSKKPKVWAAIAAHPELPQDLIPQLIARNDHTVMLALAGNPCCMPATLRGLMAQGVIQVSKALAANPSADAPLLAALMEAHGDDPFIKAEIVAHPSCPRHLMATALTDHEPIVRRKLAQNPQLGTEARQQLLRDPDPSVRAEAVRHVPATRITGGDPSAKVRRNSARKPALTADMFAMLAKDDDVWVRRWLARNPDLPDWLLKQLSCDPESEVRRGTARNPACPAKILAQLALDPEPWVRAGVSFRHDIDHEIIHSFAGDDHIDVLSGLGQNPRTPAIWLKRFAQSDNADLRRSVALNPNAPSDILRKLAGDPYALNRATLTKNPRLPTDCLVGFLGDPEPQVRFMAATRLIRVSTALHPDPASPDPKAPIDSQTVLAPSVPSFPPQQG